MKAYIKCNGYKLENRECRGTNLYFITTLQFYILLVISERRENNQKPNQFYIF